MAAPALSPRARACQEQVLNLYSSRHYQTDEALYDNFTKQTGIKINLIEGGEDPLIERIRNEGDKSPADVLITVDAGRLWRAEQMGLFQPVKSKVLESRIPAAFRHPDGLWFGFSDAGAHHRLQQGAGEAGRDHELRRPRQSEVEGQDLHALERPRLQPLAHQLARQPHGRSEGRRVDEGGRRPISRARPRAATPTRSWASHPANAMSPSATPTTTCACCRSQKPEERKAAEKVGVVLPNQKDRGTHVNVSGGGVLKHAPNREAAVRFLEYLASDQAQNYFANGNNEWPVVAAVKPDNAAARVARQVQDRHAQPGGDRQEPADRAEDRRPVGVQVTSRGG